MNIIFSHLINGKVFLGQRRHEIHEVILQERAHFSEDGLRSNITDRLIRSWSSILAIAFLGALELTDLGINFLLAPIAAGKSNRQ